MRYRRVVAVPGATRLLGSSVVARLPLGTSTIALLLHVQSQRGGFAAAGAVVAAFTLSGAVGAPLQARLIRRSGTTRVLLGCAAGHAGGLVLLCAAGAGTPTVSLALLAAATGALLPPVSSVARAVWPGLAPDGEVRQAGYALDAVSQELIWILGPLLVALLVVAATPAAAVLLSAALTLAGTALFAALPTVRAHCDAGSGGADTLRAPGLRRVLACTALMGFGLGASEVAFPAVAVELGTPALAPVLLAMLSVASIVTGLLWGARAHRGGSLASRHGSLLLALAACTLPMCLADDPADAIALSLLAGAAWSPVLAAQYALTAQLAPPGGAIAAFTWSTSAVITGLAVGSVATGILVDETAASGGFLLAAAGYASGGVLALVPARRRPVTRAA